ncbi:hypothetical protein OsJ_02197 [Oryza sativa Japonica Group]|uniref:Uncharacterized protein n=1 Tax=Oryza sativa subsp. japonica TaxID=39947 RepID=B9EXI1_ORYSJ|nr:hypothetical protein OsJ_02197 [Oryza sativa Japonica Group]
MEQKSIKGISFKRREKIASSRSIRVAGSSTSRIRAKKKYLSFKNGLSISMSGEEAGTVTSISAAEETPEARCSYDGGHRRPPSSLQPVSPFFWGSGRGNRRQQLQCAPLQEAQLDGKVKLEKDDKRRLCQWWWRHWNAILVVILDMGIVKARRRWPTFTPCQNWINNDGNSSAGP